MDETQTHQHRGGRRGRPVSIVAHRAILDAARELLADHDLAHLNLEEVAARAHVGKATIYRHWPTREALALELLLQMADEMVPVRDRGDTRAELIAMLEGTLRVLTQSRLGHVMQALFTQLALVPEVAGPFRTTVVQRRRDAVAAVLRRGMARGTICPDAELSVATELLVGPIYYRLLFGGDLAEDFATTVVDAFLAGYGAKPPPA